jgi:hypothetical protein
MENPVRPRKRVLYKSIREFLEKRMAVNVFSVSSGEGTKLFGDNLHETIFQMKIKATIPMTKNALFRVKKVFIRNSVSYNFTVYFMQ